MISLVGGLRQDQLGSKQIEVSQTPQLMNDWNERLSFELRASYSLWTPSVSDRKFARNSGNADEVEMAIS